MWCWLALFCVMLVGIIPCDVGWHYFVWCWLALFHVMLVGIVLWCSLVLLHVMLVALFCVMLVGRMPVTLTYPVTPTRMWIDLAFSLTFGPMSVPSRSARERSDILVVLNDHLHPIVSSSFSSSHHLSTLSPDLTFRVWNAIQLAFSLTPIECVTRAGLCWLALLLGMQYYYFTVTC